MQLSDYLTRVLPSVDACPQPLAEQAIRDAIDSFCRRSRVYRLTDIVPVSAGEDTYDIIADGGAVVVETLFARIGTDEPLEPITPDIAARITVGNEDPTYLVQESQTEIRLIPPPKESGDMTVTAILTISLTSSMFPAILDTWREGIAYGAMARLMAMPAKAWSNPQLAGAYNKMFDDAVDDASAKAILGGRKTTLRVQARP